MEFVLVLHNVRSNHNVGSIFRTADAAGVKKIYLAGYTPAPLDKWGRANQELVKVSLGAEKYALWEHVSSTVKLLVKLKKEGFKIFAIEQSKKSTSLYKIKISARQKYALVLGNEIKGLSKGILDRADGIIEIPMSGRKESLNVAVAFGIVIFQLIK